MYNTEYMYVLICRTAILFNICCFIYIVKSIISGLSKLFKGATKDIVAIVEKLEEDMAKQQQPPNQT